MLWWLYLHCMLYNLYNDSLPSAELNCPMIPLMRKCISHWLTGCWSTSEKRLGVIGVWKSEVFPAGKGFFFWCRVLGIDHVLHRCKEHKASYHFVENIRWMNENICLRTISVSSISSFYWHHFWWFYHQVKSHFKIWCNPLQCLIQWNYDLNYIRSMESNKLHHPTVIYFYHHCTKQVLMKHTPSASGCRFVVPCIHPVAPQHPDNSMISWGAYS